MNAILGSPVLSVDCDSSQSKDTQYKTLGEQRRKHIEHLINFYAFDEPSKALFKSLVPELRLTKLVNAVSPVFTGVKLDLKCVEEGAKRLGLKYSKSSGFVGISVRLADPQYSCSYTAIFFASGSINCVGLKSDTIEYLNECTALLKKYCIIFFGSEIADRLQFVRRITNRVYTVHLKNYTLDLPEMKKLASWRSSKYVSDAFPGVIKKFDNNSVTKRTKLLIFKTAKLIFTGIKNQNTKEQVQLELLSYFAQMIAYKMNNPQSQILVNKNDIKGTAR